MSDQAAPADDSEDLEQYTVRCPGGVVLVVEADNCYIQDGHLILSQDNDGDGWFQVGAFSPGNWLSVVGKANYLKWSSNEEGDK